MDGQPKRCPCPSALVPAMDAHLQRDLPRRRAASKQGVFQNKRPLTPHPGPGRSAKPAFPSMTSLAQRV